MQKIKPTKMKTSADWSGYPYNVLHLLPDCDCVFDSYHGTIDTEIFPFSLNTRINASNHVFFKIYDKDGGIQHQEAEERVGEEDKEGL